jgi:hypothetical protein
LELSAEANSLLPGTSSLTNLTSVSALQLTEDGVPQLRYLPPQLQELTMTLSPKYHPAQPVVDLAHLAGVTRLIASGDCEPNRHAYGLVLGAASYSVVPDQQVTKLPPNCRHLSVQDIESAQPLLELQQLERLEVGCYCVKTQQALQQLSSLSRLTNLQLSTNAAAMEEEFDVWAMRMHQEVVEATRWQGLPPLQELWLWHMSSETQWTYLSVPLLRPLSQHSTLQRLSMQGIEFEHHSPSGLADVFGGLQGLQSLWLSQCRVVGDNRRAQLVGMVGAIARLPELRDLRLVALSWDEAASAALAAATQLTGLLFSTRTFGDFTPELTSLVGQVHKLVGLRSLWMDAAEYFDVDAAASSVVHLTQLCLRECDPLRLGAKFPGAALGRVRMSKYLYCSPGEDACDKGFWRVQW